MKDFRIEELANNLLKLSVKVKEEEDILIDIVGEEGLPY